MRPCPLEERMKKMKIKEGYLLHTISGQRVVLPSGGELDLNVMITLNETGAFLWELLQSETDEAALVNALLGEYDVDEETAAKCVAVFVENLRSHDFLC